ncbi:MAG: hypothetical protein H6765_01615 [Candidatus Peribacteria bacterium]|nr:MAG: hypothetical protein H6765_01615 [Candidatus Peribacteria bacterium]
MPFDHSLTVNVANVEYTTQDATGSVKIFNTLNEEISLLPNTKLISNDGLLFVTNDWVNVPAASSE